MTTKHNTRRPDLSPNRPAKASSRPQDARLTDGHTSGRGQAKVIAKAVATYQNRNHCLHVGAALPMTPFVGFQGIGSVTGNPTSRIRVRFGLTQLLHLRYGVWFHA